jgi:hypothetical protein
LYILLFSELVPFAGVRAAFIVLKCLKLGILQIRFPGIARFYCAWIFESVHLSGAVSKAG